MSRELKFDLVSEVKFRKPWVRFKRNGKWNQLGGVEDIIFDDTFGKGKLVVIFGDDESYGIPGFNVGDFISGGNYGNNRHTCALITDIENGKVHIFYFCKEEGKRYGHDIYGASHLRSSKDSDKWRLSTEEEKEEWYNWLRMSKHKLAFDKKNNQVYHINFDDFYKKGDIVIYNEKFLGEYIEVVNDLDGLPSIIKVKIGNEYIPIEMFHKLRFATNFEKDLVISYSSELKDRNIKIIDNE